MPQPSLIRRMVAAFSLFWAGLALNSLGQRYFTFQSISAAQSGRKLAAQLYDAAGTSLFPALGFALAGVGLVILVLALVDLNSRRTLKSALPALLQEELQRAREKSEAAPEKAAPAWELAQVKLDLYLDRNLAQIRQIFWLSTGVMIAGFVFVLASIILAFAEASHRPAAGAAVAPVMTPAWIGGIAGVITEFIGATFLFIYRSTVRQAASYNQTLERMNSVGMAMQILDSISGQSKEIQDITKAEIVKLLVQQSGTPAAASSAPQGEAEKDEKKGPAAN